MAEQRFVSSGIMPLSGVLVSEDGTEERFLSGLGILNENQGAVGPTAQSLTGAVVGAAVIDPLASFFRDLTATVVGVAVMVGAKVGATLQSLTATVVGVAVIDPLASFFRTLAATMVGSAVMAAVKGLLFQALNATATLVATLQTAAIFSRVLAATATCLAALNRLASLARTLSATAAGTAVIDPIASFFRNLTATMVGAATMTKLAFAGIITLAATATASVSLTAVFQQFVAAFTGHGGLGILGSTRTRWSRRVRRRRGG